MRHIFWLVGVVAVVTSGCASSSTSSAVRVRFGENLGFEGTSGPLSDPWNGGGEGYERTLVCGDAPDGECAASIASIASAPEREFASITQCVDDAGALAGKRIRLSGLLKTAAVSGFAGVWLRVDPASRKTPPRAFDNMAAKHLDGTTSWKRHDVTVKVPEHDVGAACFGVLLSGSGRVEADDLQFEALQ